MIERTSDQYARPCLGDQDTDGQLAENCMARPGAETATTHPPTETPHQLGALLQYTTLHTTGAPESYFEQVWGDACALYEALGHRLGEPGHEGVDGW